ncbi:MAG TPA: prefoldin subunit alpha [Candidatus Thermoplasmatota archaeon]|nr:prefoldin subunit alpha [Candidatus Thermoplasmatota archaeon]
MAHAAAPPQGPSEQELRELVMRSDQIRQQLGAMEAQREYLMEVAAEARRALQTLEHMGQAAPNESILVPLGGGAYVRASVAEPGKTLTNLGSGVHAELPSSEAAARLRARVENLDNAQQALSKDIGRLSDELARASAILESYYGG